MRTSPVILGLGLRFAGCTSATPHIDDAALANESNREDWLAFGRTHSEQRFSPLAQIDASNVAELRVDWVRDLPEDTGLVATPLVAGGVEALRHYIRQQAELARAPAR